MEKQDLQNLPEPNNVMEYYRQQLPTGPEWTTLEHKKQREWKRLYRKAYPRPLFRNFQKFLQDLAGIVSIVTRFFPPR